MSNEPFPRPRCFIAIPHSVVYRRVLEVVREAVDAAGFDSTRRVESGEELSLPDAIVGELATADLVVAEVSERRSNVFFELGLARAMAKPTILLVHADEASRALREAQMLRDEPVFVYEPTAAGLKELRVHLARVLEQLRSHPRQTDLATRIPTPFFIDWERLGREDRENLCRELLTQMGYRRVDWAKEVRELDLVAELPRKDPDGFEYRELWLISMGRNVPVEMFLDMPKDPDYLLHRVLRSDEMIERYFNRPSGEANVTLLLIFLDSNTPLDLLDYNRRSRRLSPRSGAGIRVRVWDRTHLTSLVQQFPQIGYKYFSDEARSRSKYRKSPEELYKENVGLTNRLTRANSALEDEKNRRVRAERDAVWKDISFTAAHRVGNPIFAIETNLDPLERRIREGRQSEALEVVGEIRSSVDKAKDNVEQFKSLTRAQEIKPSHAQLLPLLEESLLPARNVGVNCDITSPPDLTAFVDPIRISECFTELASNAIHWTSSDDRRLSIQIAPATAPPQQLDSARNFVLIDFRDNGGGVSVENKNRIFDAFFTTRDQGTGLGLALVRRIVEGHGGAISETGIPGEGAHFELFLPSTPEPTPPEKRSAKKGAKKKKLNSKT
jgi:signal transduction histidine kinase